MLFEEPLNIFYLILDLIVYKNKMSKICLGQKKFYLWNLLNIEPQKKNSKQNF